MITFFKIIIYTPLYNLLILILNINWIDAGVAAIILTLLVKLALYPLTKKTTITQIRMKEKEAELALIKQKYTDKQEQAVKVMEFYKQNKINPFASFFTILIQIPVIYSLYYIFFRSGLPVVDYNLLYPFIKAPIAISMNFLGILDVSRPSLILGILAAVTSFLQMHYSTSMVSSPKTNISGSGKEDFSKMMGKQMKYTMPIIVFLISWKIAGVVALYWTVSNIAGIAQDFYLKKQIAKGSI